MDDMIGRQLGDYLIEVRIGRGGMARVYRAHQASVNRPVAVKMIATDYPESDDLNVFRERFAREAKVIASLEHTHILPIYDYGIVDDTAYLVMRFLEGGSLSDLLAEGPPPLAQVGQIFGQIARGLAYAHSKGIIHRDLKPANIMFASNGDAFLTDFGLAKWIENSPVLTQSGKIVGTPAYMSPEQLRGDAVDQRADIYSMGIILYQMTTGELPFDSESGEVISIIYQHLEKEPPKPTDLNPELPPAVEHVILKALEKTPNLRYANILQMANDLDIALGRRPSTSDYTPTPLFASNIRSHQPAVRRTRWLALAGAALAILLALILGVSQIMNINSAVPKATIQLDVQGRAEDIVPTSDDIARAQRVLGDSFIAYITCNQTSEYHATQAREMGDFAHDYGLDYQVYDSNTNEYSQITQLERARADGAGGLIICPLDPGLLLDPLQSVNLAGIPLVILSQDLPNYGGMLIVGDEYQMGYRPGELAGKIIAEEMGGEADVIILDFPDLPHIVARADGLVEGILAEAPKANIIGRYRGATPDFARESVSQLIEDGVHFDVIASINDAGTFGAIEALDEADIPPDSVVITSVDAEQLARRYIREGYYIRGSVDVGRTQFSRAAIDAMTMQLAGNTLPEIVLVPPGDMVTAETLASEE